METHKTNLEKKAYFLRDQVLEMCIKAGTGHVSSCFSCMEIMVALYYSVMKEGDKFIMSKGHASPLLYAILSDKGYISKEELETFCQPGSRLGVHINNDVPGVEAISGSLGYGLGIGAGMAYADRNRRVFVLLGDAECQEGSIWETAMFAGKHNLNNLVAILDQNGWGATASNRPTSFWNWDDFGWEHLPVDGHNFTELLEGLTSVQTRPLLIKAMTVKGKGISFMANPLWHGVAPTGEWIEKARQELYA